MQHTPQGAQLVEAMIDDRLSGYLARCAQTVDEEIRGLLAAELQEQSPMQRAIAYHLGWADERLGPLPHQQRTPSSGKKLRPAVVLLCFEAARDLEGARHAAPVETATAFAAAVELLHNFSLVHDDVQDGSAQRRGRPALWSLLGTSVAINTGDCLHALAHLALACREPQQLDSGPIRDLLGMLGRATVQLTVGQGHDLALEDTIDVDLPAYLRMITGKTGALMRCAAEGGALLALGRRGGPTARTLALFEEFGLELGLCFQIRDDWLGIWGTEAETGKPASADIRQRKKTFPVVIALQQSSDAARRELRALYAQPADLTDAQQARVRAILEDCDAPTLTQHGVELHARRAHQALARAAGDPPRSRSRHLAMLDELTDVVAERTR